MRPLFLVYATLALLMAAGIGPASQAVRDASLGEIEELEQPRPLGEYGFLKAVRPYLPPLVVDWIVVKRTAYLEIPDDADLKIDPDGRFVLVWPEGCEESYDAERGKGRGPDCPEPPDDPCGEDTQAAPSEEDPCGVTCADGGDADDHPGGTCPEDVACAPGEEKRIGEDGDATCIASECPPADDEAGRPDNATDGNGTAARGCETPMTPAPSCPDDTIMAYDGTCVPRAPHTLWARSYAASRDGEDVVSATIPLKVPYGRLLLEVRHVNQTQGMTYSVTLDMHEEVAYCWVQGEDECQEAASGRSRRPVPDEAPVTEDWEAVIPPGGEQGNATLTVSYTQADFPTAQPRVWFTLVGVPAEA